MIPTRKLGFQPGVQLDQLLDGTGGIDPGSSDQMFAVVARLTRGRIDRPFLATRGNFYQKTGPAASSRLSALNEAKMQVFEGLGAGAASAVVSRLVTNGASKLYVSVDLAPPPPTPLQDVWLSVNMEDEFSDHSINQKPLAGSPVSVSIGSGSRTGDLYAEAISGSHTSLTYSASSTDISTGPLTLEFDFYAPSSMINGFGLGYDGTSYLYFNGANISDNIFTAGYGGVSGSFDTWHHVAVSIDIGLINYVRWFLDGVLQNTSSGWIDNRISNLSGKSHLGLLNIGDRPDLQTPTGLRIDNVVITKATKYITNFTPPGAAP